MLSQFEINRQNRDRSKWNGRRERWGKWKAATSQERFDGWKRSHPSRPNEENPYFLKDRD